MAEQLPLDVCSGNPILVCHEGPHRLMSGFVLLDRDGTINVERGYLTNPEDVQLLPGALQGLKRLADLGLGLVVITNQSAVGRGYMSLARLQEVHDRLVMLLAEGGVVLDGIYSCPHTPADGCACRKPRPGLVYRAASELGFDPKRAYVVGDNICDIELGKRVGATTLLVRTGHGDALAADGGAGADYVVDDLVGAAEIVKRLLTGP